MPIEVRVLNYNDFEAFLNFYILRIINQIDFDDYNN